MPSSALKLQSLVLSTSPDAMSDAQWCVPVELRMSLRMILISGLLPTSAVAPSLNHGERPDLVNDAVDLQIRGVKPSIGLRPVREQVCPDLGTLLVRLNSRGVELPLHAGCEISQRRLDCQVLLLVAPGVLVQVLPQAEPVLLGVVPGLDVRLERSHPGVDAAIQQQNQYAHKRHDRWK